MINYTIIIPHKNIPDLLQRCLSSIPRRDDVQIIVIDDNSDADKVDFTNFPGLNNPFVEIIFGKNDNGRKGAGYARNLGLEKAKGKWLVFADADDYFMPCFNDVLELYKNDEENDIVFFKTTSNDLNNGRHIWANGLLCGVQKSNDWTNLNIHYHVPYGKFIKTDIVKKNNIYFQEVKITNDALFAVKVHYNANRKKIDNKVIYLITERSDSLTANITMEDMSVRFNVLCDINKYFKEIGVKAYYNYGIQSYWLRILKIDKITAIKLLPRLIINFNILIFVKIILIDCLELKKYFKKTKILIF
jgi:glycosyltransferase involved in cell wall biosynthesis